MTIGEFIASLFMGSAAVVTAELDDAAQLHPMACTAGNWTAVYDENYRSAALAFWAPERVEHWCWLKAQGIQESGLRTDVNSPVGAAGIAQFMPGTWADTMQRQGWSGSPYDPMLAIRAQAVEMERLSKVWRSPRPETKRIELASASYNAGVGHIVNAQGRCQDAPYWDEIRACLPDVTGDHSKETIGYVDRIRRYYTELTGREW